MIKLTIRFFIILFLSCQSFLSLAQHYVPLTGDSIEATAYFTFDDVESLQKLPQGITNTDGLREVFVNDEYKAARPNAIVDDNGKSALFLDYEGYLSFDESIINKDNFTLCFDYKWTGSTYWWVGIMSFIGYDDAQGKYAWTYFKRDSPTSLVGFGIDDNINEVSQDKWYHITLAYDAGIMSMYLDGTLVGKSPSNQAFHTYSDLQVHLGATLIADPADGTTSLHLDANGRTKNTQMYIDNLAIFDHSVPAAQVAEIYANKDDRVLVYTPCAQYNEDFEDMDLNAWGDVSGLGNVGVESVDGNSMMYLDYATEPKTVAEKTLTTPIEGDHLTVAFDLRSERNYVNVLISLYDDNDALITSIGYGNSAKKSFILYTEVPSCYDINCASYVSATGEGFITGNKTYQTRLSIDFINQTVGLSVDGNSMAETQDVNFISSAQNIAKIVVRNQYFYANSKKFFLDNITISSVDKQALYQSVVDNKEYLEELEDDYRELSYTTTDLQSFLDTIAIAESVLQSCDESIDQDLVDSVLSLQLMARNNFDASMKVLNIPVIFSDGMVLQRNREVCVWGWKSSKGEISLSADWSDGVSVSTMADLDGYFELKVMTPPAGGPYSFTIDDGTFSKTYNDVMSGDVWLCTGQSNMDRGLSDLSNTAEEVANAEYPNLRIYIQAKAYRAQEAQELNPQYFEDDDLPIATHPARASWVACSPSTIEAFSATGYMFGRQLTQELPDVPIGLIEVAKGASNVQTWIEGDYLRRMYGYAETIDGLKNGSLSVSSFKDPSVCYNGMIAPLTNFEIYGAVWYQGESNAGKPEEYRSLLPLLIDCWRDKWRHDFPFYIVQLASYKSKYELQRESQFLTGLHMKKSGTITAIDIGDYNNIHPANKQETGRRLALWALHKDYGLENRYTGPSYGGYRIVDDKVKIGFLPGTVNNMYHKTVSDNPYFISADGINFVEAQAEIDGDSLLVYASTVSHPVAARYAFEAYPEVSLYNADGLPALPFRTDQALIAPIYVEEKKDSKLTIKLFAEVDALSLTDVFVITHSGGRVDVSSINKVSENTFELVGDFTLDSGWIYINGAAVSSGAPVSIIPNNLSYQAEILSFSAGGHSGQVDSHNKLVTIPSEALNTSLSFTLSDKAESKLLAGDILSDLPMLLDVYSESGIRKRWTIIEGSDMSSVKHQKGIDNIRCNYDFASDQLSLTGHNSKLKYTIVDVSGKAMLSGTTSFDTASISLVGLDPNLYLLHLSDGYVFKFIKF